MSEKERQDAERRIAQDRAEIGETIDAIGDRMSPGQLLDQAMDYVRSSGGGEMGSNLARQVKANPLPLVLTGVGLVWLMSSSGSSGRHDSVSDYVARSNAAERARVAAAGVARESGESESAHRSRVTEAKARALSLQQKAGETADSFTERVEDYIHQAEEAAKSMMDRTSSVARSASHAASDQAQSARAAAGDAQARLRSFYSSEPLLAGALGVAAGLLAGCLLPTTRAEDRMLGEYGEEVRAKGADLAATAKERGKKAATEGAAAAANAAASGTSTSGSAPSTSGSAPSSRGTT